MKEPDSEWDVRGSEPIATDVCECGHTDLSHAGRELWAVGRGFLHCQEPGCTCERLTWVRWTPEYEAAIRLAEDAGGEV